MVDIVEVNRHDPLPTENADFIQVVRRQDEKDPQRTLIDVDVFVCATGKRESLAEEIKSIESAPMADIVKAAARIADDRNIETIYVADLTPQT